jgi:hypothetical protein
MGYDRESGGVYVNKDEKGGENIDEKTIGTVFGIIDDF